MPLKQNQEHHIHHLIHIILFKLLWEFRESPKFLNCVTKLHKGLGRWRGKGYLYYWKRCLRRGSGILSELDRGVHLVREALLGMSRAVTAWIIAWQKANQSISSQKTGRFQRGKGHCWAMTSKFFIPVRQVSSGKNLQVFASGLPSIWKHIPFLLTTFSNIPIYQR